MKKKSRINSARAILYTLESHRRIFDLISQKDVNYGAVDMIERLKMQRQLFIKEICRVFDIDKERFIEKAGSDIDQKVNDLKEKELRESSDASDYIDIALRLERSLESDYDQLVFNRKLGEIALMILKNQLNEIKRDKYLLDSQLRGRIATAV